MFDFVREVDLAASSRIYIALMMAPGLVVVQARWRAMVESISSFRRWTKNKFRSF